MTAEFSKKIPVYGNRVFVQLTHRVELERSEPALERLSVKIFTKPQLKFEWWIFLRFFLICIEIALSSIDNTITYSTHLFSIRFYEILMN